MLNNKGLRSAAMPHCHRGRCWSAVPAAAVAAVIVAVVLAAAVAVAVVLVAVAMVQIALSNGFVVAAPPSACAEETTGHVAARTAGSALPRRARLLRERGMALAEGPAWAAGAAAAAMEPCSETELAYMLDKVAIHRIQLIRA